jgi:phosphate transport system substrate-binding protein
MKRRLRRFAAVLRWSKIRFTAAGSSIQAITLTAPPHRLHVIKLKSTGPVEKHVEANKYSIAMSGISSAKKRNVSFMSLSGHEPSYANIASGAYPLYRPLYLVTRQDSPKEVNDFIDYAKSQEGQKIIKAEGTVNLQDGSKLWPLYAENMRAARQEGNF